MKYLNKLSIFNLWEKEKVDIDFFENVTFLTGYNGSGKSTILNILFDTLNPQDNHMPATSKNRFWGATAFFSDNTSISKACFPLLDSSTSKLLENIEDYIGDDNLFCFKSLNTIKNEYQNIMNNSKYSIYDNKNKGIASVTEADDDYSFIPFIYQDDRKCLHNIKDSNIDFDNDYWGHYGNQLDERFCYVRDALQLHESKMNKTFTESFLSLRDKSPKKKDFITLLNEHGKGTKSIKKLDDILNTYFNPVGKTVSRDENDKIELQFIETEQPINWYELSRGEKTIIYLLLSAFLYGSKVNIFLFDEPDISIHIEWQEQLVKHLVELAPNCQFVIATHSPALIMNGWLDRAVNVKIL
jgi:predicted ATP-binding protein involved in virulence